MPCVTCHGDRYFDDIMTVTLLLYQQSVYSSYQIVKALLFPNTRFPRRATTATTVLKVLYDPSDSLESVERLTSARRALTQHGHGTAATESRRLEFENCTACEEAWDALCAAVPSVCDLVDYGSPFGVPAAASVDTTCETFGSACSSYEAREACQGQCTEGLYRQSRPPPEKMHPVWHFCVSVFYTELGAE